MRALAARGARDHRRGVTPCLVVGEHEARVEQDVAVLCAHQRAVHPNLAQPTKREKLDRRVVDETSGVRIDGAGDGLVEEGSALDVAGGAGGGGGPVRTNGGGGHLDHVREGFVVGVHEGGAQVGLAVALRAELERAASAASSAASPASASTATTASTAVATTCAGGVVEWWSGGVVVVRRENTTVFCWSVLLVVRFVVVEGTVKKKLGAFN